MDKTKPYHNTSLPNKHDVRNQLLHSNSKEKNHAKGFEWINIKEKLVMQLILDAFVDPEKKKILNLTSNRALSVPEILEICKMPTTSGYRVINALEKNGLLVKSFNGSIKHGKKIYKYRSIFENVKINIDKDKVTINVKILKE